MTEAVRTLLHPFAQGLLPPPGPGRGAFLRAEADAALGAEWRDRLLCEQSLKPAHDALAARGFHAVRRLEGGSFDLVLCLLTKHKAESLANVARAWALLAPGGLLVCAGTKDTGAASVERQLRDALGALGGGLSKNHGRVFWARRDGAATPADFTAWLAAGALQAVPETGALARPGIYGWNKVDEGSRLLAESLPEGLAGRVADLGAGWGYLSLEALRRRPAIARIDLYEAEGLAFEAAEANLARLAPAAPAACHWHDVTAGLPAGAFDWVLTNPPFHSGKATDIDLGRRFVAAAAEALAPGGTLFLVANRHLPYEAAVDAHLKRRRLVAETAAFKVIEARR
ncbi:MAG TPA: methyltransferase [Alphaproteobacteria bacterium]|nr:methyltransferase [Alphaproteobacteria bacterium]